MGLASCKAQANVNIWASALLSPICGALPLHSCLSAMPPALSQYSKPLWIYHETVSIRECLTNIWSSGGVAWLLSPPSLPDHRRSLGWASDPLLHPTSPPPRGLEGNLCWSPVLLGDQEKAVYFT